MRSDPPPRSDLHDALGAEPDAADLERVWDLLGAATPDPAPDTDAAWQALQGSLHRRPAPARTARPPARPGRRARWAGVSALAVAALALALWAFVPVSHHAPLGETVTVALPDGSTVALNSGASIRHPRWFGDERAVSLAGEAFFDVRSASAPFVVSTHNARIEVLGTSFNVRSWDEQTTVALVEGRVEVTGSGHVVEEMQAGDAVVLRGPAAVPAPVDADVARAAAWRTGALAFDGLPLAAVLAEVERRYAVSFTPTPDTPLGAEVSAFYAEQPSLDALLSDLGAVARVRFTPEADGYSLRPAAPARQPTVPN